MTSKLKVILITVVCTSIAWALAIAAILYFQPPHHIALGSFYIHSPTNGVLFAFDAAGPAGDPSSVEWEPHDVAFRFELVSSNTIGSVTGLLYCGTSRPPERIWFRTTPLSQAGPDEH